MPKIETVKVLEITDADIKGVKKDGSPIFQCSCSKLAASADIVIFNGKVIKNRTGKISK